MTKKRFHNDLWFWVLLLLSFVVIQFFSDGNRSGLGLIIAQNSKRFPAMFIAAYAFNDWLIPRYYNEKKYVVFGIFTALILYTTSALDRIINVYIYEALFREPPFEKESIAQILSEWDFLVEGYLTPILFATFLMALDRSLREKRTIQQQNIQLERDKKIAELNALKSQLHPHFLFNTLNNLYALTVQKSDKAPETVATLSEMLDYILYECNDRLVSLDKEVKLLENYIALEGLRYGDEIEIDTQYTFAKAETQIVPLVLLSIVENAFKHGASGSLGAPEIQIDLTVEGQQLYFTVKNTKNETQQKDDTGYSKGIGVANVQQQLSLLYPDFDYQVTDENGWYCVALRINTAQLND